MKLQIVWKVLLASFVLLYWLPPRGQGETSKDRELYPFAYATVACYISKGKIPASSWQETIIRVSSQWGISLSSITETDFAMAGFFSAHIAPYFGNDCDPNKIPARHIRSALARAIDDGRRALSSLEGRNEAIRMENTCLQAELDRDKAAAGKSYTERIGIEAAYSYMYKGQCIFTPMKPSF